MGKLLHTIVPVDEGARYALLALLPVEEQGAYVRALQNDNPALLVVLGTRDEVAELDEQIREEEQEQLPHKPIPWPPPIVRGTLPSDLGTFRREDIYD